MANGHLATIKPHLMLLPSVWPETYCYLLSIALAAGIQPPVFNVGAQAEWISALGWGHILPTGLADYPGMLNDHLLELPLQEMWRNRQRPRFVAYARMADDYYGFSMDSKSTGEIFRRI